ncbi:unnamed protein product [Haemonchus placei]|uniref:Aldedh domain-containing protein n=1 Tax=Haemonchus placei TaxID=6290 RepID=A0A0N4X9G4_HAEPC|nr:unnamed protein product [Haemonchus placei]
MLLNHGFLTWITRPDQEFSFGTARVFFCRCTINNYKRHVMYLLLKTYLEQSRQCHVLVIGGSLVAHSFTCTPMREVGPSLRQFFYNDFFQVQKTFATALDQPMIVREPLGVVLIMSPWNYPLTTLLLPLIPAIAAGNTVVIKPSEVSANTAAVYEKLFPKYFKPEYLSVINGGVPETTELLKERFDHILYTGCPPVGKIVMEAAAKHLTPPRCDRRRSINEFYGSDIKASRDYSRIINQRHFDRLNSLLDSSKGTILFIGDDPFLHDEPFLPPTHLNSHQFCFQIFGPVLPVLTVKDLSEAIEYINEGEKPLAAYIFTRSDSKAKRFYMETSSGGVTINDVIMHITVDTLPFGGVGTSGMGRYRGRFGFDTFTHEKAVLKRGFFGESLLR